MTRKRGPVRVLRAPLVVLALCGLGDCSVGPDYTPPALPAGAGYARPPLPTMTASAAAPAGRPQALVAGADIPGRWWTLFRSPTLDALEAEALEANPDASAAQAALRQAEETRLADEGALFPSLGVSASQERERFSGAAIGEPALHRVFNLSTASLSISYAPDVFGGVRRQVEAAAAAEEALRYELEATYLTLTTNVVNAAVTMASIRDQIAVTREILQIENTQLEILMAQRRLGAIARADLLAQQTAIEQTEATVPPLTLQLTQARVRLLTLVGRFPSEDRGESLSLAALSLPDAVPVSLPSRIIEQRPDVLAAAAELHQASAEIGVAVAARLPQFAITGDAGSTASTLSTLFGPGTQVLSLAGSIGQSVFDAGAGKHRERASRAAYSEAKARYRATVLAAFGDVADSLHAECDDAESLKTAANATQTARDGVTLAAAEYRHGTSGRLAVLSAELAVKQAALVQMRAEAARFSDTAALIQALGGGWWNRADASPPGTEAGDRFTLPPFDQVRISTVRSEEPMP